MPDRIPGLRVLLVEDEELISELIVDILETAECQVVGPFARLDEALRAAGEDAFDVALLDLNLAGTPTFPVASVLASRQLPFIFLTGFGKGGLPAAYAGRPVIAKPFKIEQLLDGLAIIACSTKAAESPPARTP